MKTCSAIIVAAGTSRRAGFDKLMAVLDGLYVLRRSLDAFLECPAIREIVLVCPEERFVQVMDGLPRAGIPVRRVDGGSERHFSVSAGLDALQEECPLVAIHDGARPLLRVAHLMKCIEAAGQYGAAASAHPIVDTLKRADDLSFSLFEEIDRSHLWAMETPQVFDLALIREAYKRILASGESVTDEVSALEKMGRSTYLVQNPWPNPKITHPGDLAVAMALRALS